MLNIYDVSILETVCINWFFGKFIVIASSKSCNRSIWKWEFEQKSRIFLFTCDWGSNPLYVWLNYSFSPIVFEVVEEDGNLFLFYITCSFLVFYRFENSWPNYLTISYLSVVQLFLQWNCILFQLSAAI